MYKKIPSSMTLHIVLPLIISFITKGNCQVYTNPVYTESGPIVGLYQSTILAQIPYASYRGIPFAEPITKLQRFKPPIPKEPWDEELYAIEDKERCMQIELGRSEVVGSEDCLYLNVYVPKIQTSDNRLKPVIVWIHGGAFTTGNGNSSYYGPDFLLEEDVIVVSIQYRLGALGFLNLNHPNATGNAGLKDQVLALRWIHKNIQYFGGDPNQITLFGQSAGGVSVDLHKLSDMSVGLFNKTISMSASPLCKYWPFQSNVEARKQATTLGKRLGAISNDPNDILQALINANASDIIATSDSMPMVPFRPTLEKSKDVPNNEKFLTECTPKKYKEGNYTKGPQLMGYTSTEILFMAKSFQELIKYHQDASRNIKNISFLNKIPIVSDVLSWTFKTVAELKKKASLKLVNDLSDIYFGTGIDMKQRLLSNNNDAPIYYYKFNFRSNYSAHKSEGLKLLDGVAHEDELPYAFYRPHLELPLNETKIKFVREVIVKMWTNFAKYGNPTPYGENDTLLKVTWPDSRGTGAHLEIADQLYVHEYRPTNLIITIYQKFGFGDCSIYNDCDVNLLNDIVNGFANLPATAQEIFAGAKNAVNSVVNTVTGTANKVVSGVGNTVNQAVNKVNQVRSDVIQKAGQTVDGIRTGVENLPGQAVNTVTGVVKDVKGKIGQTAEGIKTGVENLPGQVANKASEVYTDVKGKAERTAKDIKTGVENFPGQAVNTVSGAFTDVKEKAGDIFSKVTSHLPSFW